MMKILDHGYIELIETWGSDERIIESARMSTQKGFGGWGSRECQRCGSRMLDIDEREAKTCLECSEGPLVDRPDDEKLLAFLWKNRHHTPFEMAGATFEIQAPIIVFREWHRHRTQSYNEMSARYAPLPAVDYIPSASRLMIGASLSNKQAGTIDGAEAMTEETAAWFQDSLHSVQAQAEGIYRQALLRGVPKELARLSMTVGRFSRIRASANLRNWLAFLSLRMDKAAQWEIRQYANAVYQMLSEQFPRTLALTTFVEA